jgi:hypothetical protein
MEEAASARRQTNNTRWTKEKWRNIDWVKS